MNTPPIVSPQEWEAAREQLLVKEKELTRARDALAAERRRMPRMAVEKDYRFEGPDGPASLLDLFDGPPPADRLPLLLRARRRRGWPEQRLRRLLVRRRPGRPPRPPERARHDARVRLARAAGGHRALEGADGLGASPGTRSPTTSTPTSASTSGTAPTPSSARATGSSAPTSSTAAATRRWAAPGLPRHHRARPPGGVGGLAGGLPADPAVPVVELPRRVRRARRDRPHRRRAARGAPPVGCRRGRRAAGRARAGSCCACDADGSPDDEREHDAAHGAHVPGARPGGLRRVDQRGGDAALVARRARLGDDRGRGRPARRRRACGW